MTKHEAALAYASWGWHVIPVVPNGKVPATQHGVKDATTDAEQITRWWTLNPNYNIGIAAGERSGIIVFDIDPRNGGDDSWNDWTRDNGQVPDGAMQMTAGGGFHHIAEYTPEIRSCKLLEGVDLLADGRYFVACPSEIEGRRYEWEASSDPFEGVAPFCTPEAWMHAYHALRKPAAAPHKQPGEHGMLLPGSRNSGLAAMGGAMRRHGFAQSEIMAALSIANETRCDRPLPASELLQIVRSVSRYEPETDVGVSASMGAAAADAIIAVKIANVTSDYFLTRATSYLGQPSPIEWVIKGWIPSNGITMLYGESGCGKTMIGLDIACHVAAGLAWNGHKTKQGIAVYLAGEGNYGIRIRVAAWCKAHGVDNLDNLLISNRAIDMDGPNAAAHIIAAVRELTAEDVELITTDTLNNHMSGNENDATETRKMLNAMQVAWQALNSAMLLLHHIGNAVDAKHRARGSSAWKASMDAQLMVVSKDGSIEISCTKMKDAEHPSPIFGSIVAVPMGWIDEDGEEISGAIFQIDENPPEQKQISKSESDHSKDIRKFTNAWFSSGAEDNDGIPYLSRSALIEYLITVEGLSESTAITYSKQSKQGRLIYNLVPGKAKKGGGQAGLPPYNKKGLSPCS
jgi:hypothetical protein